MILDATCGKRMMWFDKQYEDAVYVDKRREVKPDVVCDFKQLPFREDVFEMSIFDPPHCAFGETSHSIKDFGSLRSAEIIPTCYKAAEELQRVTQPKQFIIFKWNDLSRPLYRVMQAFGCKALFGQRTAAGQALTHTYWVCFRNE